VSLLFLKGFMGPRAGVAFVLVVGVLRAGASPTRSSVMAASAGGEECSDSEERTRAVQIERDFSDLGETASIGELLVRDTMSHAGSDPSAVPYSRQSKLFPLRGGNPSSRIPQDITSEVRIQEKNRETVWREGLRVMKVAYPDLRGSGPASVEAQRTAQRAVPPRKELCRLKLPVPSWKTHRFDSVGLMARGVWTALISKKCGTRSHLGQSRFVDPVIGGTGIADWVGLRS